MSLVEFTPNRIATAHHVTAWIEAGPAEGPLMIFLHGWPELGLLWRAQLAHFAAAGWRCVAPDMRGYGASSVPARIADYAVRAIVGDMLALHDALGGQPALRIGHTTPVSRAGGVPGGFMSKLADARGRGTTFLRALAYRAISGRRSRCLSSVIG